MVQINAATLNYSQPTIFRSDEISMWLLLRSKAMCEILPNIHADTVFEHDVLCHTWCYLLFYECLDVKNLVILDITWYFHYRCPPRTFLPALCKIFLDESAPDNVLEVTARAITYYLDVSAECTRRIVGVDGAIKALCNRLVVVELNNRTSRDLAEQCVKVMLNYLLAHLKIRNKEYILVKKKILSIIRLIVLRVFENSGSHSPFDVKGDPIWLGKRDLSLAGKL